MIDRNNQPRIFGLDLMRAAAIMMVLLGHITWIFPPGNGVGITLLAFWGYLGVETFFVLSGFLIGNILLRMCAEEHFNFTAVTHFIKRRWFRTLPNYFLILLVNMIIATIIGYEITGVWKYFVFAQNFASPMLGFFPESWSLSVEEFVYLLLPLTLLFFNALFRIERKALLFLLAALSLVVISIFFKIGYNQNNTNTTLEQWNIALKMVVVYRIDAILIGVVCSWLYYRFAAIWIQTKFLSAAVGLFLLGFLLFGVGKFQLLIDQYPFFWNVIYLPLTSITLALFLPVLSQWQSVRSRVGKPITFISKISYSMYLLHYGVVLQLMKYFISTDGASTEKLSGYLIIYLFLTFALSTLLYCHFEKPMTNLRDK